MKRQITKEEYEKMRWDTALDSVIMVPSLDFNLGYDHGFQDALALLKKFPEGIEVEEKNEEKK